MLGRIRISKGVVTPLRFGLRGGKGSTGGLAQGGLVPLLSHHHFLVACVDTPDSSVPSVNRADSTFSPELQAGGVR